MKQIAFTKMHGLGNDFVIFDKRHASFPVASDALKKIAHRSYGVGCDQILILEPARNPQSKAFLRIFNATGDEVTACGNGTRCIAWLLAQEGFFFPFAIETQAGLIYVEDVQRNNVTVRFLPPSFQAQDIPLAGEADPFELPLTYAGLQTPVAVSMGNPHLIFFTDQEPESFDLTAVGTLFETHPLFPARTNVGIAHVMSPKALALRVWERHVGITSACGTGACAAVAAAHRLGFVENTVDVLQAGGPLKITLTPAGPLQMTGEVQVSFHGTLT